MRLVAIAVLAVLLPLAFAGSATTQEKAAVKVSEWNFKPNPEGITVAQLCQLVHESTGKLIIYNPMDPAIRAKKVHLSGPVRLPAKKIFDWFRSLLAYQKLVVVPTGPREANQYAILNMTDPAVAHHPVYVPAEEVHQWEDRDGAYISTLFTLKHAKDTTRMRTALANLVSRPTGRIQDVPGSRSFVVADFGPVVAAIGKLVAAMDKPAPKPVVRSTMRGRVATGAARSLSGRAVAVPSTASTLARYEQMLASSETETAVQYFLLKINALKAGQVRKKGSK